MPFGKRLFAEYLAVAKRTARKLIARIVVCAEFLGRFRVAFEDALRL